MQTYKEENLSKLRSRCQFFTSMLFITDKVWKVGDLLKLFIVSRIKILQKGPQITPK